VSGLLLRFTAASFISLVIPDGPAGNPKAIPDPQRVTNVPWHEVRAQEEGTLAQLQMPEPVPAPVPAPTSPAGSYRLADHNAVLRTSHVYPSADI